jgi:hypothetical protein
VTAELTVLSGQKSGTRVRMSRFPFTVGRSEAGLSLADPGVWDTHFRIELSSGARFILRADEGRIVTIDGADAPATNIPDGATIGCGSVYLRFQLSPTDQRDLGIQNSAVWAVLGLVVLLELAISIAGIR